MTYLSTVEALIIEYETLFENFRKLLDLAKKANLRYAHITLNVDAAIEVYHVI